MTNYTLEELSLYNNNIGNIAKNILAEVELVKNGNISKAKATLVINDIIKKNHLIITRTVKIYDLRNLAIQAIDSL